MESMNPLNLPEIITAVGRYLPLWKYSDSLGFYDFNPSILLSCTLINKTWFEALTPVIWHVYNGFVMRSIPTDIIIKHSGLFRIFFYDRSFLGPFLSRHLKTLVISWWDQSLLPLVEANAGSLQNVDWKGSSSPAPVGSITLPSPDYDLLMRMAPTLRELKLSHWTLSGKEFVKFLATCKRISSLSLTAIDWTDPLLEAEDNSYFASAHFSSNPSSIGSPASPSSPASPNASLSLLSSSRMAALQYHPQAIQGLTKLHLDVSVSKEDAFADLIRSCPDLEMFSFYSESAEDARTLIPIMREFCPKLSGIEYVSRFSSALDGRDYLSDAEYANLVISARKLKSLKIDIPWLDDRMTRALLVQSSTLESLSLWFYERRPTDMIKDAENINMVVQTCVKLRHLSISFNAHSLGREETLRLFDRPWTCVELETLVLTGVIMTSDVPAVLQRGEPQGMAMQPYHRRAISPASSVSNSIGVIGTGGGTSGANNNNDDNTRNNYSDENCGTGNSCPDASASSGTGTSTTATMRRYGSLTKQKLFEQAHRLPNLKSLSLNHVLYIPDVSRNAALKNP
ncbi:hypothetical protein BG011_004087 [Mortierella polycephala]|uniref:Uncharacterized protein n=1 Tax=Mortierella polycephala TaxID=41804 RepID=A0A9P6Q127_9FUNG|nr:hypothetical protein BG011_004087 [Mortierella polycephala]